MKIALPLLLVCLTITPFAQTPGDAGGQRAFSRVERIGEANARSFFVFSAADRNYAFRHDGFAEIRALNFVHPRHLNLKMGGPGRLERLYTADVAGDLLLIYEVVNGNGGWGFIARLDQEARTFRWIAPIASLNIGPGLVEDNYVYLTGQDFLAKLDLQSGKYVWQQTEFAKQYGSAFLEFGLPEIDGATVMFRELSNRERTIKVDKATGAPFK
jgi:hypothetical protein